MEYLGEHLWPGRLGHFFVVLSFASSLVATIAFWRASKSTGASESASWKRLARCAFALDIGAAFTVFVLIYYILSSRYFEYNFAWEHSSRALSGKYLLSCIWEAQEGSFLLWTLWHCVLGAVLMIRGGRWEAPVMTVLSFAQVCLATMILGIYVLGLKVGLNPFILVRQLEAFRHAPIFQRADYLSIPQMQDGQGLNALLHNYWMVIHPPVLFLGFASTIVPFSFAVAGLWRKQYGEWTQAAQPWTLFSACVLGTGILMGAAWAYESLSFGGYWAWDPVENASLVPWLVMVAGLHTLVAYRSSGHSLRATYFFFFLAYGLVLYSTFLTRSGVLGDSSVHAFVDSGMNVQLLAFLLVFFLPALGLLIKRYREIPHIKKEESVSSREFWMFIGSVVLFLTATFVILLTSIPLFNLIFHGKRSLGEDAAFEYNRIVIFLALLLGLLTGATQYLKYRHTSKAMFLRKIATPTAIALIIAVTISWLGGIHYTRYGPGYLAAIHLALFGAVYGAVANAGYIWVGLRGKLRAAGASVAHLGFGILLLGVLLSSAKKQVLSYNTTGITVPFDPASKQDPMENITLLKSVRTDMGTYWATYLSNDSLDPAAQTRFFHIRLDPKDGRKGFDLYPYLMKATKGQEGFAFNPDKHHFWSRDIFSYVSAVDDALGEDTSSYKSYPVAVRDTVFYSRGYMILDSVVVNPREGKFRFGPGDTALLAAITVYGKDSLRYSAHPLLYIRDNRTYYVADTVFAQDLAVSLGKILDHGRIELLIKESGSLVPFVALKVLAFPQINLLWGGALIMILGFVMSILRRAGETRARSGSLTKS
jgi:cytochrome c-type biogenesis protein CcmF